MDIVNINELKASYSEYSDSLDLGGYFWVEQQVVEASGFGYAGNQSFD